MADSFEKDRFKDNRLSPGVPQGKPVSVRNFQGPILMSGRPLTPFGEQNRRKQRPWIGPEEGSWGRGASLVKEERQEQADHLFEGLKFFQKLFESAIKIPELDAPQQNFWPDFYDTLRIIDWNQYFFRQHIVDLDMFLRNFVHLIRDYRNFINGFQLPIRQVSRRDEVELLHLGFLSLGAPKSIFQVFSELHLFDPEVSEEQNSLNRVGQDFLQYSPSVFGRIENQNGLNLYISRQLLDSVRYLHYRNEMQTKPSQTEPHIQKIGSVLVYFAIRGQLMQKEMMESILGDYYEGRGSIPAAIRKELDRKFPATLSVTRKSIEEIAYLGQDPRNWGIPGLKTIFGIN